MFKFFNYQKNAEIQDINWSTNRYSTVVAQRNVLLILALLLLIGILTSVLVVFKISTSRTIEPFIIEIDKKSGAVNVVNPVTILEYSANDTLRNYFITDYIRTREVFDPYNYNFNHNTKIRVFSSRDVFNGFRRYIESQDLNSLAIQYQAYVNSNFRVISIDNLHDSTIRVVFTIKYELKNGKQIEKTRTVMMSYKFAQLELNDQDRYINPLGFQVTYYKLDNYRE